MMNFVSNIPGAAEITADLISESQDWPNAERFGERLKVFINQKYPGLIETEDSEMSVEQLRQMVSILQTENQNVTAQLEQALSILESQKLEAENNIQVAQIKEAGDIQQEQIKAAASLEKQKLENEGEIIQELIKKMGEMEEKIKGLTQIEISSPGGIPGQS